LNIIKHLEYLPISKKSFEGTKDATGEINNMQLKKILD